MEAIITAFILFVYLIIGVFLFAGGFYLGRKKRPSIERKEPTEEEKKAEREFENFMTYSGVPQEAINDK